MNRQPIPPDTQLTMFCTARAGKLSSTADIAIDWAATLGGLAPGSGADPEKYDDGIGQFKLDDLLFDVYVDLASGQLWYDADKGWQ